MFFESSYLERAYDITDLLIFMIILPSQAFIDSRDEDRPTQGLLKVKTLASKSDNQSFVGTHMVEENCLLLAIL